MQKIISYVRVSTKRQGTSGLGLDAQELAISNYIASVGGTVIARYLEVESGRKDNRPELLKALAHARRSKATILIAKWDRLSRDVAFLSNLLKSDVEFRAVDNPHANKLTIHVLAAVAQDEAERASERTKAALRQAKARGIKLGSHRPGHWEGREEQRKAGALKGGKASARRRLADSQEAYADLAPSIRQQHSTGDSLRKIAARLNAEGHTTRNNSQFTAATIQRILQRAT
jgi:DNA invertase Pin-like site-specific DNA recombinase